MYHSVLIDLSANGHLGCFHTLNIVKSAVLNMGVQVFLSILISLVCMQSSGFAGLYNSSRSSFIFFKESSHAFNSSCIRLHSLQQCKRVPFSQKPFQHLLFYRLINSSHSDWHEIVSPWGFGLHFSDNE